MLAEPRVLNGYRQQRVPAVELLTQPPKYSFGVLLP